MADDLAKVAVHPASLEDAVAELQKEVKALRDAKETKPEDPKANEVAKDEEPQEAHIASPYSFVLATLLDPQWSFSARAVGCLLLGMCLFFQIILVYAFTDTSDLLSFRVRATFAKCFCPRAASK